MAAHTPRANLREDERLAGMRQAVQRAKRYRRDTASPVASERKLHELARRSRGATGGVKRTRRGER